VFTDLVVDPTTPGTVYLGVTGQGVFKVTSFGSNCSASAPGPLLNPGTINNVALAISNSSRLYAAVAGAQTPAGDFQGIFATSTNTFPTWTPGVVATGQQGFSGSQSGHNWALGTNPTGDIVLLGGVGLSRGTGCTGANGCSSFIDLETPHSIQVAHTDHHSIVWQQPGIVWDVNDGGIFKSVDDGQTWQSDLNTLGIADEIHVDVEQTTIAASAWDVGGHYTTDGGNTWVGHVNISGADGYAMAIDPSNNSHVYSCYNTSRFYIDGGNWTSENNGLNLLPNCNLARSFSGTLFTANGTQVWKTTSASSPFVWSSFSGNLTSTINSVFASVESTPTVYVTTATPNINFMYVSVNNKKWSSSAIPATWPSGATLIRDGNVPFDVVALDHSTGDVYLAAGTNSQNAAVFMSPVASHGLTAATWVSLAGTASGGIPIDQSQTLSSIAVDSATRSLIATTEGTFNSPTHGYASIYRLNNPDVQSDTSAIGFHHWRPWVNGLPHGAQIIQWATGEYENGIYYYYIATWGRGVWRREARGGDY
jgi:hypothetical protein